MNLRWYCLLLTYLCFFSFTMVFGKFDSNIPDFYFYSEEGKAFLIEYPSQGTREILADYEICVDCWVRGPGWSQSGEWFAWTVSSLPSSVPIDQAKVYVTNTSVGSTIELTGVNERTGNLSWSPMENILLYDVYALDANYPGEYRLYDANLNVDIVTFPRQQNARLIAEWLPSNYIVTYSFPFDSELSTEMSVYDADGSLQFKNLVLFDSGRTSTCGAFWTPDQELLFTDTDGNLIVSNMVGEISFSENKGLGYILGVDWNLEGSFALIYASNECTYEDISLWLFSYGEVSSLQKVSDNVVLGPINRLTPASAQTTWNPTNDRFYFTKLSDGGTEVVFGSTTTNSVIAIKDLNISLLSQFTNHGVWTSTDSIIFVNSFNFDEHAIVEYQLPTLESAQLVRITGFISPLFPSHTGDLVAFGNSETCDGVCILSLEDNAIHSIQTVFDEVEGGLPAEEIIWHPDDSGLIMTGLSIGTARNVAVADIKASDSVPLGRFVADDKSGFGWMPD